MKTPEPMLMGTFKVESGQIRVTDPCYCPTELSRLKHRHGILQMPALNGRWFLRALLVDDGVFGGVRTQRLEAFHESYFGLPLPAGEHMGDMFVDSGQMGVFDDAKFPREPDQFEYDNDDAFYKRACNLTYDDHEDKNLFGGCMEFGGVTTTGYGDGSYPSYVHTDGTGLAVSIAVEFISEDEDEEEYDDDFNDDDDEESEDEDDDEEDEPDDDK